MHYWAGRCIDDAHECTGTLREQTPMTIWRRVSKRFRMFLLLTNLNSSLISGEKEFCMSNVITLVKLFVRTFSAEGSHSLISVLDAFTVEDIKKVISIFKTVHGLIIDNTDWASDLIDRLSKRIDEIDGGAEFNLVKAELVNAIKDLYKEDDEEVETDEEVAEEETVEEEAEDNQEEVGSTQHLQNMLLAMSYVGSSK